ncbi:DoxX family protein [Chitinophagaceae bacterium IBVUCB2]|nr:DoxX family protein [Chitinophagaceae bacterium IBVUCB2]
MLQPLHIAVLRITIAIILLTHSIPSIVSGDVNLFGKMYLNEVGFAPFGISLAWAIKLSHIFAALCLILNRWLLFPCLVTIAVLITGIFMVHLKDGWFVIGGGRNGIEYNVLLVAAISSILLYNHSSKRQVQNNKSEAA